MPTFASPVRRSSERITVAVASSLRMVAMPTSSVATTATRPDRRSSNVSSGSTVVSPDTGTWICTRVSPYGNAIVPDTAS